MATPSSIASAARCAACASRSPTAATCAASTACRRRTTPGCRARRCSRSRRSRASPTPSCELGVDRVRITGGEPLLRRDLPRSSSQLAARPAIRDLALTTNGVLLARQARGAARRGPAPHHRQPRHARPRALRDADAVRRARRRARRHRRGRRAGFDSLKIDTVVMRGVNDDELVDADRVRPRASAPKCASSNTWTSAARRAGSPDAVVSRREMLARARGALRPQSLPLGERGSAPGRSLRAARRHRRSASSPRRPQPFCADCDRSRLTADGVWLMCLYAQRRHRPAPAAARGRDARRTRPAHSHGLVPARRSRRRRAARGRRTPGPDPARGAEEGRAPRDAYAGVGRGSGSGLGARGWGCGGQQVRGQSASLRCAGGRRGMRL